MNAGDPENSSLGTEHPGEALEPRPLVRRGWLRALLFLVIYAVCALGLMVVVGVGFAVWMQLTDGEMPSAEAFTDVSRLGLGVLALTQLLTLALTVAVVAAMRRLVDRRSVTSLGLELRGHGPDLVQGMLWGAGLIVFGFVGLLATGSLQLDPGHASIGLSTFVGYLAVLVVVAVNEELMIRGYLLSNLMDSMNRWVALFVSALVFATLHLLNANVTPMGIVNLVLAGIVLGVYYLHRGNLCFGIGMHLTWNLFQGPVFGFEVSGLQTPSLVGHTVRGPALLTGGEFGLEGSILTTIFLLAAAVVIHLQWRTRAHPPD